MDLDHYNLINKIVLEKNKRYLKNPSDENLFEFEEYAKKLINFVEFLNGANVENPL